MSAVAVTPAERIQGMLQGVVDSCPEAVSQPMADFFGTNLLSMTPEDLEVMEGNAATIMMAQVVCYMKSRGQIREISERDSRHAAPMLRALESLPSAAKKAGRR